VHYGALTHYTYWYTQVRLINLIISHLKKYFLHHSFSKGLVSPYQLHEAELQEISGELNVWLKWSGSEPWKQLREVTIAGEKAKLHMPQDVCYNKMKTDESTKN
jgi:hypothetical protein